MTNNLIVGASHAIGGYSMGHIDGVNLRVEGNTLYNCTVAGFDMPSCNGKSSSNYLLNNFISLARHGSTAPGVPVHNDPFC